MPRKSKKDKNKGRLPFFVEKINEKTKESFIVDIQNLTSKLEQYEEKHKNLLERCEYLEGRMVAVQGNERTRLDTCNRELSDKTAELTKLKDELNVLKENKMADAQNAEKRIQELRRDIVEMKDRLTAENKQLASQLRSLEDFKVHKNEVESKVEHLKKQLEERRQEHEQNIGIMKELSNELALRTKEEALERLTTVASHLREESAKEMPELLRRALKENAAVGGFNGFVSNKSQELEQEIKELRRSAEENGRIIQNMERKEKELFKEYISTKKLIKMLREKLELHPSISCSPSTSDSHQSKDIFFPQLREENENLKEDIKCIRQECLDLEGNACEIQLEVAEVKERLSVMDDRTEKLKNTIVMATDMVKKALFGCPLSERTSDDLYKDFVLEVYDILKERNH